jgi:hypothetical protein
VANNPTLYAVADATEKPQREHVAVASLYEGLREAVRPKNRDCHKEKPQAVYPLGATEWLPHRLRLLSRAVQGGCGAARLA